MNPYVQLALTWLWASNPTPAVTVEAGVYEREYTIAPLVLEWTPVEGFSVGARVEITEEADHVKSLP